MAGWKRLLPMLLALLLAGCGAAVEPPPMALPAVPASPSSTAAPPPPASTVPLQPTTYIQSLVAQTLEQLPPSAVREADKARWAYAYLVTSVTFADPVGLDCWQYRGQPGQPPPTYLETRALSPLAFGLGSCEDYAAALVLLLQGMGIEARYLPGLTLSVEKVFVDHAWVVAKVEGDWYHLDPQLERNITHGSTLAYRFFLKGDQQMLADHLWGSWWLSYGKAGSRPLTAAQTKEIAARHLPPACPRSYPSPAPHSVVLAPPPNLADLKALLQQQKQQYQQTYGPLPPVLPNVLPPVFGIHATRAAGTPIQLSMYIPPVTRYARSLLSPDQQQLYDRMQVLAAEYRIGEPTPLPPALETDATALAQAQAALLNDYPQYYWASYSAHTLGQSTGFVLEIRSPWTVATIRQRQRELDQATEALLTGLSGTPDQLAIALYDRLMPLVRYTNQPGLADTANLYGTLVKGQGVCNGFSRAYQYLAQQLGLPAIYIAGSTSWGTPHAWNAVQLEDGWYYLDVTWGRSKNDAGVVYHDYLLVTRREMDLEHIPLPGQYSRLPDDNATSRNYYIQNGYTAVLPSDNPQLLGAAFAAHLDSLPLEEAYSQVYCEVKILADSESYQITRDAFIKNVADVLLAMNQHAQNQGLPWQVQQNQRVTMDYNDATQTLSLYLYAKENE